MLESPTAALNKRSLTVPRFVTIGHRCLVQRFVHPPPGRARPRRLWSVCPSSSSAAGSGSYAQELRTVTTPPPTPPSAADPRPERAGHLAPVDSVRGGRAVRPRRPPSPLRLRERSQGQRCPRRRDGPPRRRCSCTASCGAVAAPRARRGQRGATPPHDAREDQVLETHLLQQGGGVFDPRRQVHREVPIRAEREAPQAVTPTADPTRFALARDAGAQDYMAAITARTRRGSGNQDLAEHEPHRADGGRGAGGRPDGRGPGRPHRERPRRHHRPQPRDARRRARRSIASCATTSDRRRPYRAARPAR